MCLFFLFYAAGFHQLISQPVCGVTGPDSVFFDKVRYNAYVPPDFEIEVVVHNPAGTRIDSLVAFPRSNPRFTVISPPVLLLADSLLPGDSARARFHLIVQPRAVSGEDTVIMSLSGKSGMRGECLLVIWVEKEYKPENVLLCPSDTALRISFVDTLNTYVPAPLVVPLRIENRGDAPSKDTRLLYVATPGLAPADGQDAIVDIGTLQPGAVADRIFRLRIVPRTSDTTVGLRFKVQGYGGLGDRIIDTICETPVTIPALRDAAFELHCDSSPHIVFDRGVYTPNPFEWAVTVHNSGDGFAKDVRAAITLPSNYRLDSLEQNEHTLGNMPAGSIRQTTWRIRALPVTRPDTGVLCTTVYDVFAHNAQCCDTITLPPVRSSDMRASCLLLPDTIGIDASTGIYQPSQTEVRLQISNPGTEAVDSVWAEIVIADPDIDIRGGAPVRRLVAVRLLPNGFAEVSWMLAPRAVPQDRRSTILFRVSGVEIPERITSCQLRIAASLLPALVCSMSSTPADTLHYNIGTLQYDSLTLSAVVRNTGSIAARGVRVSLLLPSGMGLAAGDSAVRSLGDVLETGGERTLHWRLDPAVRRDGRLDTIRVEFHVGAVSTLCEDWIFIVGIPPVTVLSIPSNNLAQYNRELRIPIEIDNADGKQIQHIDCAVRYNPAYLELLDIERTGDMLENWTFFSDSRPGRIDISARSDTSVLAGEGILMHARFRVVFGALDDALRAVVTPLSFDTVTSAVNRGGVIVRYFDGAAVLSGDCLPPLNASDRYVLLNASPNPTSGALSVHADLREQAHLRLVVVDALGREVYRVADAIFHAGTHRFTVPAGLLRAGRYYILATAAGRTTTSAVTLIR
ncbi:MAG: hypothetical protein HY962_04150 [Ignavibacteriae bacterium]|nr:hypothetical protein [Ignavibacteriota bacterium]